MVGFHVVLEYMFRLLISGLGICLVEEQMLAITL